MQGALNKKYICPAYGYEYDTKTEIPKEEIKPEFSFEDLPDNSACPVCDVDKKNSIPQTQIKLKKGGY